MAKKTVNTSWWDHQTFHAHYDVLVVGSGLVGLRAAWRIKSTSPSLKVGIIDRGSPFDGASTRNAGVACFGTVSEILADMRSRPEEEVFQLVEKRILGLQVLLKTLGSKKIGFEPLGGFELFPKGQEGSLENCSEKLGHINAVLSPYTGTFTTYKLTPGKVKKFGFKGVKNIIENVAEGQLDTGRMMEAQLALTLGTGVIPLFGNTVKKISSEEEVRVMCENGSVFSSRYLLLATNGYTKKLVGKIDVSPARAQVIITKPIRNLALRGSFHFDEGFYYFRNVGDRVLFGGGRNLDFKTETTMEHGHTEKVRKKLVSLLNEMILPGKKPSIEMGWSGIMGVGKTKSPIVQDLGNGMFCAVRMGGMGVALGSLTGDEAGDMILRRI